MRKTILAIAAAAALGASSLVTGAMAAPFGGAGHAGGSFGGHVGGGLGTASGGFGGHMGAGPGVGGNFSAHTAVAPSAGSYGRMGHNFAATGPGYTGRPGYMGRHDFDHDHDRFGRGWGGWGGLYAFGGPWYGYGYDYGYDDGCWVRRLVPTPWGLSWRLVNVCY